MASGSELGGVVVTSGGSASNQLGVVRSFGKRGIPVVSLDSGRRSSASYSKYITTRLKCPSPMVSTREFVDALMDFGRINSPMMIVPTGDMDVLAISKHKTELEEYYFVPVSDHATVEKLVNKRLFYELLAETNFPHPKTYFPENLAELESIGRETPYPYIVRPIYSPPFHETFGKKNFAIRSPQDLELALEKLRKKKTLKVLIQEVVGIPGKQIYAFYAYFNRKSEPITVCGYDKIRQRPLDFGSGSYCRSNWRAQPIEQCIRLLQTIRYHGFAEAELKLDPRDGQYKLLEINARTTLQNYLAATCGANAEYAAYLEANGEKPLERRTCQNNVFWVDDFADYYSRLQLIGQRQFGFAENVQTSKIRTVHTLAAWDDLSPFLVGFMTTSVWLIRKIIQ